MQRHREECLSWNHAHIIKYAKIIIYLNQTELCNQPLERTQILSNTVNKTKQNVTYLFNFEGVIWPLTLKSIRNTFNKGVTPPKIPLEITTVPNFPDESKEDIALLEDDS